MMSAQPAPTSSSLKPLCSEGLVKRFGQVTALDGITLELNRGECLGLLGPNGAGKSTLIRSIVGRVIPDAGTVTVFGSLADSSGARAALGWVPQELALYSRLTCRENLEAFGRYHGLGGASLQSAVARCLEWAVLADRAGERVSNLSGGMKRRLNMAAGLIHEPRLMLMDEPTVGVDPQSRNAILESVEKLSGEGMAVLYTTHYMEEAERLCDRIGIVDLGELKAEGTRAELVSLVGEHDRVALEGVGDLQAAADASRALEEVRAASVQDGAIQLIVDHARSILPDLLTTASDAGMAVNSVDVHEPDLEAVFLHLTGKALRD